MNDILDFISSFVANYGVLSTALIFVIAGHFYIEYKRYSSIGKLLYEIRKDLNEFEKEVEKFESIASEMEKSYGGVIEKIVVLTTKFEDFVIKNGFNRK